MRLDHAFHTRSLVTLAMTITAAAVALSGQIRGAEGATAVGASGGSETPEVATQIRPGGARLLVSGLFCPFCEGNIEKGLRRIPGVREVAANWKSGEVLVEFAPEKSVERADLEAAVRAAGFTVAKIVFAPESPLRSLAPANPAPRRSFAGPAPGVVREEVFSPGSLRRPQSFALAPDGTLWIADTENRRIVHASADGALLGAFTPKGLLRPTGIDVAADGTVAVTDFLADRVLLFGPDGAMRGSFGGSKAWQGLLDAPADVLFLHDGTLLVVEFQSARVQHFDRKGNSLGIATGEGRAAGRFTYPTKLQQGTDGRILVSDTYAHRIVVLGSDLQPATFVGKSGRAPGDLQVPGGVGLVGGDLWIADFDNHRVQALAPDGTVRLLLQKGADGALDFERPLDIAVSRDGRTVYVLEWAGSSIHRLQLEPGP